MVPLPDKSTATEDPTIVDHAAEHTRGEGVQEAFPFDEAPSGPYQLPDTSVFQNPPEGARSYDRESLIMNSRILDHLE